MIKKIRSMYFSPTGNSKKVADIIGNSLSKKLDIEYKSISINLPSSRIDSIEFSDDTLVIFSMPTYAGKLPNKIMPFISEKILGKNTKCIAVVTYGNRNFDNSIAELTKILLNNGFEIIGAACVVGEHPFSKKLGKSRPDENDILEIEDFSNKLKDMILQNKFKSSLSIPGNEKAPYYTPLGVDGLPSKFLKATPLTNTALCNNCKICANKCPMESIDYNDTSKITGICIKCHACIKSCPKNAKFFDDENLKSHIKMLEKNYSNYRAKNYFF